jgi:hypothetical protein
MASTRPQKILTASKCTPPFSQKSSKRFEVLTPRYTAEIRSKCLLITLQKRYHLKFVLTVVNIKIMVLCNMTPCSLVERYQHIKETCCLNHHGSSSYPEDGGSRFLRNVVRLPVCRAIVKYVFCPTYFNVSYKLFVTSSSSSSSSSMAL